MSARYLTTRDVARMLSVSEQWVRDHAGELGGMKLSDSPRSPLRFDERLVDQAMERRRLEPPHVARRRRPGPQRRRVGDVELLPLPTRMAS